MATKRPDSSKSLTRSRLHSTSTSCPWDTRSEQAGARAMAGHSGRRLSIGIPGSARPKPNQRVFDGGQFEFPNRDRDGGQGYDLPFSCPAVGGNPGDFLRRKRRRLLEPGSQKFREQGAQLRFGENRRPFRRGGDAVAIKCRRGEAEPDGSFVGLLAVPIIAGEA